jgi:hypothetical protein
MPPSPPRAEAAPADRPFASRVAHHGYNEQNITTSLSHKAYSITDGGAARLWSFRTACCGDA